ncbi:hypothetical protein CAAN1_07S03730 [[Candida] anglica]|uniref:Uncharacterized protein n=1 Tax=[Candida] anglica TaxID=148631 RepID=A0ABP0EB75_9ASCO
MIDSSTSKHKRQQRGNRLKEKAKTDEREERIERKSNQKKIHRNGSLNNLREIFGSEPRRKQRENIQTNVKLPVSNTITGKIAGTSFQGTSTPMASMIISDNEVEIIQSLEEIPNSRDTKNINIELPVEMTKSPIVAKKEIISNSTKGLSKEPRPVNNIDNNLQATVLFDGNDKHSKRKPKSMLKSILKKRIQSPLVVLEMLKITTKKYTKKELLELCEIGDDPINLLKK